MKTFGVTNRGMTGYIEYTQDGETISFETTASGNINLSLLDKHGCRANVTISDNLAYVIGEELTRKIPPGYEQYARR